MKLYVNRSVQFRLKKRWKLRRAAGWNSPARRWPQDALRHTFANYHLSHFRSYAKLQLEIGHRDATLLRTRYANQRGVRNARAFWEYRGAICNVASRITNYEVSSKYELRITSYEVMKASAQLKLRRDFGK